MTIHIKRIDDEADLYKSKEVLQQSFATVAKEFHLTQENAPTNAAFIEITDLLRLKKENINIFGVFKEGLQIGFFTIEKNDQERYFLNKIAVLPEHRHNGYGGSILEYVFRFVNETGGGIISIGIINENLLLKNWYLSYGFSEIDTRTYSHLPFTVCILEKIVTGEERARGRFETTEIV